MTPERRTLSRVDVPLPGGRLLRLELHHNADGEPETLTLAAGWGDPPRLDTGPLSIPAASLPDLRAALAALDNTPTTEMER